MKFKTVGLIVALAVGQWGMVQAACGAASPGPARATEFVPVDF